MPARRLHTAGFETRRMFRKDYSNLRSVKRQIRKVADPFALPDHQFEKRFRCVNTFSSIFTNKKVSKLHFLLLFRLNKRLAFKLIKMLSPYLSGKRPHALQKWVKILTCLQVFAHGSYQVVVADCIWTFTSQASVSRCVNEVTEALLKIQDQFIVFPQSKESRQRTSQRYFKFLVLYALPPFIFKVLK